MEQSEKQKLSQNLETFGLVDPIIINLKNNHIIGGHQRFNILQENEQELNLIRLGDIGWVFPETELKIKDNNHEKALNLSLNSLDGEFDKDKLGKLLLGLQDENFDVSLTGFNDEDILDMTLDFELELIENNTPHQEYTHEHEENIEEYNTTNINFSSQIQKNIFLEFIQKLKEKNPDKQISTLLTEYIQNKQIIEQKTIKPYIILFNSVEEKRRFDKLYQKIKKYYKKDPLLLFIME